MIEDGIRERVNDLNGRQTSPDQQRQLESVDYVKKVMSNLTNTDHQKIKHKVFNWKLLEQ